MMIKANEPKTNDYEFQYDIKMRYEISLTNYHQTKKYCRIFYINLIGFLTRFGNQVIILYVKSFMTSYDDVNKNSII